MMTKSKQSPAKTEAANGRVCDPLRSPLVWAAQNPHAHKKTCVICEKVKPREEFEPTGRRFNGAGADGLSICCSVCYWRNYIGLVRAQFEHDAEGWRIRYIPGDCIDQRALEDTRKRARAGNRDAAAAVREYESSTLSVEPAQPLPMPAD